MWPVQIAGALNLKTVSSSRKLLQQLLFESVLVGPSIVRLVLVSLSLSTK